MKGISRTTRRRRKEGKTDYKARIGMLRSGSPRLVVRKTNRYIIAQIVTSHEARDTIVHAASSKELLSHGWPENLSGSLKNLGAAYLTGLLIAKKSKVKKVILDIGLYRNIQKGRIYSLLKGAIDGGMHIAHNKESLPSDDKIKDNDKTKHIIDKVKEKLKNG